MLDTSVCQKPGGGTGGKTMHFRGIRSSKFKHVYGAPAKKSQCYDNIKITRNAGDANFCAANPKFLAVVVEVGGGGSFLVLPLDQTGRIPHAASKVSGHSRPVLDIKWNPFNDNIIASASEDCTVKLWYIPDGGLGLASDLTEHLVELQGHRRRVTLLEWHPTAENILLSAGFDHRILIWNIAKGQAFNTIECHPEAIYSMSLNRTGSLLATTCKDKKLRIIDPRSGEVLRVGDSHQGNKASKVVYLGDTGRLLTTGFSKFSDRQIGVWSQQDLSSPLRMDSVDCSSGVLFPFYDHDTHMIYIAGKGDGNVRYYELLNEEPYVFYLSQFISGAPQRGFGAVPKRGCVTAQCEIFRFYKLHATKDIIEPISMIVPRKSESFQDDIYPETQAPVPSLTAEEWISGRNASPILMSLKAGSRIRTYKPVVYKPSENAIVASDKNNDRKFMFLSEETQPDYRPIDVRMKEAPKKPCPRIDHRPLGADSYSKSPELTKNNKIDQQPKKNGTNGHDSNLLNNKKNSLGSKFQDVQRKWMSPQPPSIGDSDLESELRNLSSGPSSLPLGHSSVKSLSHKFQQNGNGNGHSPQNGQNGSQNGHDAQQVIEEQRLLIEKLKAQVTFKDRRIQQLEDHIKLYSIPMNSESGMRIQNSESIA